MPHENWYWDTCIFIAFLNNNRSAYGAHIDQIGQFLDDCRRGDCSIYTSTITLAEITKKHLVNSAYRNFSDFLQDFGGSITQVVADPNVMLLAAAIRGLTYTKTGGMREMGTPDAIHLASAIVLEKNYGVPISAFHTFDNGKARGLEGKSVPLLSYDQWCEVCADDPVAQQVLTLNRTHPDHPNPQLPLQRLVPEAVPLLTSSSGPAPVPLPQQPPLVSSAAQESVEIADGDIPTAATLPETLEIDAAHRGASDSPAVPTIPDAPSP
jgi:predicted nucleic acid-binding protein